MSGEICVASMTSEVFSLAGPEVVMMLLGMLTYTLFSGYNFLPAYWSHVDDRFPGRIASSATTFPVDEVSEVLKKEKQEKEEEASLELDEEKTGTIFSQATEMTMSSQSGAARHPILVQVLAQGGLDTDSVANVFLCLELKSMAAMGCTCKAAKEGIWEEKELWLKMGGPNFLASQGNPKSDKALEVEEEESELGTLEHSQERLRRLEVTPEKKRVHQAKKLREQFRVWVFGLEAGWSSSFADSAGTRHHADVFDEATFLLGGLTKEDGTPEQIQEFAKCLTEQLNLLDAGEEMAKEAALRLTEKAKSRQELLGRTRVGEMLKAFEASTLYARVLAARMPL